MITSSYVHIPFCKRKCNYCSFFSVEDLGKREVYVEALLGEIRRIYDSTPQKTIYFGGGTPSLLSLKDFERILDCFEFASDTEITVEINPESVTAEYLRGLRKLGVNRLSIGIQSFDDEILKVIGRGHRAVDSERAFSEAREAGFENISIDLMYGLPEQSLNGWERDLTAALSLAPEHISLYGLKIDEGCRFYKNPPKCLPDDDLQADMYLKAVEILTADGFKHYEISNFARGSKEGRHNLNYWKRGYYHGFGSGAGGFIPFSPVSQNTTGGFTQESRYKNSHNIKNWQKIPEKSNPLAEEIFLGFRLTEGININEINKKYNVDFEKKYALQLKKFLETGHILKIRNGYRLSLEGFLLSNLVLSEFI